MQGPQPGWQEHQQERLRLPDEGRQKGGLLKLERPLVSSHRPGYAKGHQNKIERYCAGGFPKGWGHRQQGRLFAGRIDADEAADGLNVLQRVFDPFIRWF